uniref:F-box domain-containing protein n=1 Tax=Oryza punctata TaxID=4537 RepID=A0A0E0JYK9_ORYPU
MEDKGTPPPEPAAVILSVLANDDLLREILLRLGLPTTLVRAALVSTRWLRLASDRAFLRRFRARHPPRLLGFYHTARARFQDEVPAFVPLPQPPELDVALRRASFRLAPGASGPDAPVVLNCRNGRVLAAEFPPDRPRVSIISPIHPARESPALPLIYELPRQPGQVLHASCMLLFPDVGSDDPSYTFVEFLRKDQEMLAKAVSVRAGILDLNNVRESATIEIQESWERNIRRDVLVNGNLYLLGGKGHILGLNLASMRLFLFRLPDGVQQLHRMGNIELLHAGDSGLYLVHLKGFQIHVWLRASDSDVGGGNWELVDTICLRESFGQVAEPDWESGDALVALHRVEDNVEVFLRVDRVIFHIHITNRTVKKVFEMSPEANRYFDIFPFVMLWPPTFPQLSYDHGQNDNDGNQELADTISATSIRNQGILLLEMILLCSVAFGIMLCRLCDLTHVYIASSKAYKVSEMAQKSPEHIKIYPVMMLWVIDATRPSSPLPPPSPAASAASSVLADDDLLREILLRLGFPTTLVRASLVSSRWLRLASDRAFLRRFRARNPPRLLGFYHTARRDEQPAFVPLSQPPELAPVLCRLGGFTLGGASGDATVSAVVFDCRNGRLLRAEFPPPPDELRFGVVSPLLHPARQPLDLPPTLHSQILVPHDARALLPGWMLLPEEDGGDDLSYTLVVLIRRGCELFARSVFVKGESNQIRTSDSIELPKHWPNKMNRGLLFHGCLYMLGKEHVLVLNLVSMSLFLIKLPDGVEQLEHMGNLELFRSGDSGLYLVHLKGFQIHVWHHATDGGGNGGGWEMVDTMSLHQSFGEVARPDWESGDPSLGDAFVSLRRVEDNAELFLTIDRMIFHIHIVNRTANKVFEMTPKEDIGFEIFPFMMIWPPTFPALNYDDDNDQ